MTRWKKIGTICLALAICACTCACGGKGSVSSKNGGASFTGETESRQTTALGNEEKKILRVGASFSYPSLDAHKEYYGWFTSLYGVTETLFKLGDDASLEPWLAESAEPEGSVWTVTLKKDAAFSNGEPLTPEAVIENLQRVAKENGRFSLLGEFTYQVVDQRTFTATSKEPVPTFPNTLACPEVGMMDLEHIKDLDNAPIGTGPFVVKSFEPEGTVEVEKNPVYWGGEVALDEAVFLYLPDDSARLMAMQNGEIDCDNNVTAAAMQVLRQDPEQFQLFSVPTARLQFYLLNETTMDDTVREAVNLAVDGEAIAAYLEGTVTPVNGPFRASAAYGKASKPEPDPEQAKALLEGAGYSLDGEGYYEKDGERLTLNVCYYASRSLDTVAALMQEQLKAVGVEAVLTCEEDPDATYIATGDFDIGLYCMIADQSGDPEYFLSSTLKDGAYYNVGGFDSPECQALLSQLSHETDPAKRAELANSAVQLSIDDNALGYVALFNKITALRAGVSGFAETSPYDIYGLSAETDITRS